MNRRDPPHTEEGWYALHDFRRIRWDDWEAASAAERERAIEAGVTYLERADRLEDAPAGDSATFSVVGHKADLMLVHLRPTLSALDRLERQFERTPLARFTDQPSSYVSVTEVSGYTTEDIADGLENVDDQGLRNYLQARLHPSIPDATHVSFYPMDKRRDPAYNWYDLPFDERADLMAAHGEIGREYAGQVTQIITGSIGLDDYEWGVTLFAEELTAIKHLLTEMRFDPSSSRYAEFGPFYVGRRFPPGDLGALFAGETLPTTDGSPAGRADAGTDAETDSTPSEAGIEAELSALGLDPGAWAGHHAIISRSDAEPEELREEVATLRENFDHYDRHVHTAVETGPEDHPVVVSVWTAAEAAETARTFLAELVGVDSQTEGPIGESGSAAGDPAGPGDAGEAIREQLADLGIYGGQPHGEDVYALVSYSTADIDTLVDAVDELRDRFVDQAAHVKTAVYRGYEEDRTAVASIWETADAAETAGSELAELPGVEEPTDRATTDGFSTMGMFYAVEPDHRDAFLDRFDEVAALVADLEGHRETTLLINVDDECDTFIDNRWRSREAAMSFFRSDAFAETISLGREILADRPRHVFLT